MTKRTLPDWFLPLRKQTKIHKKCVTRVHYTVTIYGYKTNINGKMEWVYIGQTRVQLEERDKAHLSSSKQTAFDRVYRAHPQHFMGPITIEKTSKECFISVTDSDTTKEHATLLADCQEWMDTREIHWIKEYGTYRSDYPDGLNMTKGGQNGWNQAYFEYRLKKSERMFGTRISVFQVSEYGQNGRLWETHRGTVQDGY
jgi:hypothetical protein